MNKLDKDTKILIVGLGLIGGSYAKGFRAAGIGRLSAIDSDEKTVRTAIETGLVEHASTKVEKETVASADLVVFALYPEVFVDWIRNYGSYLSPGTVLTDVTGVKTCIVYKIQEMLPPGVEFIAAHPMAGREVYGLENSDETIFRGANYIVVPTEKNSKEAIDICTSIGRILGFARISQLSPEEHDEMVGFLSQLTHCIAVSLMTCKDNTHLVDYTGDSFRDLTRIARINDAMWSELFLLNRDELLQQMDLFIHEFSDLRYMLARKDREGLREKMRLSTQRRAYFNKPQQEG
ncbi:MAG: prephenate dehydrogenase [Clostridia bacterium]|nr:prephenate dehydrogenase [Clostridia bacterium]